jgi:polysaccharide biosynthesis protein PslH
MVMDKSILVVSSDFPFPANHGGRVDIWNRIQVLKRMGLKVDLICTVSEEPNNENIEYVKKFVNNIFISKRDSSLLNLVSFYPFQMKSRKNLMAYSNKLDKYDFVLLESEYVYPIIMNRRYSKKYILRVHNDEAKYLKSLFRSTNNHFRKIYYFLEFIKFNIVNKEIKKKINNFIFISNDEFKEFKNKYPSSNSAFLPTDVNINQMKSKRNTSKKVLFIGSLFMVNNQEGIIWYLNNVHPKLNDIDKYELLIAGNSRGEDISWLKTLIDGLKNVKFYDSPEDLDFLYEESSVFINPMLNGAGVKLKTIEALKNGLPVVSTRIGAEGTGLEHGKNILISDDSQEFAKMIKVLLESPSLIKELVESGQNLLKEEYNAENNLQKYFKELNQ